MIFIFCSAGCDGCNWWHPYCIGTNQIVTILLARIVPPSKKGKCLLIYMIHGAWLNVKTIISSFHVKRTGTCNRIFTPIRIKKINEIVLTLFLFFLRYVMCTGKYTTACTLVHKTVWYPLIHVSITMIKTSMSDMKWTTFYEQKICEM